LKKIAESELFKELVVLKSEIKEIEDDNYLDDGDWKTKCREQTLQKSPLLKQSFYKHSQLYSNNKVLFSSEETERNDFESFYD
jgi:hypothetical protein